MNSLLIPQSLPVQVQSILPILCLGIICAEPHFKVLCCYCPLYLINSFVKHPQKIINMFSFIPKCSLESSKSRRKRKQHLMILEQCLSRFFSTAALPCLFPHFRLTKGKRGTQTSRRTAPLWVTAWVAWEMRLLHVPLRKGVGTAARRHGGLPRGRDVSIHRAFF